MNPCLDLGYHPGASSCIRAAGPGGTGQQVSLSHDDYVARLHADILIVFSQTVLLWSV